MISETIWEIVLVWIISAFCGLVVGQFVEPREMILTIIMCSMVIGTLLLTIYYAWLAWREWKREQRRKNHSIYRGGRIW